jgi:hypothetical protein
MDTKPQPNRKRYVEILRTLTPEERVVQAFALTELVREALKSGLRRRFPEMTDAELHLLYLSRLETCHNRNY